MLDGVFALNGVPDVVELLEVNQSLQSISLGETGDEPGTMLEYPTHKVARHADIQNAVRSVGQNVNVAAFHAVSLQDVDGRDKPGHDGLAAD